MYMPTVVLGVGQKLVQCRSKRAPTGQTERAKAEETQGKRSVFHKTANLRHLQFSCNFMSDVLIVFLYRF